MNIKQVKLIYFSPTGTTQKVLESIAQGITDEVVEHINLTRPDNAQKPIPPFSDELILIGAPVYGGRLPVDAINRFKQIKASKTLAIPIVVYGNREFEDALLELKNLAIDLGFHPVAGAAFIGEHSFATKDAPIANGRPDSLDVQKAKAFGAKIKEKKIGMESGWELAARYEEIRVDAQKPFQLTGFIDINGNPVTVEDNFVRTLTLGVNKYINYNVKFQVNYEHDWYDNSFLTPTSRTGDNLLESGDVSVDKVLMRMQLFF